MALSGRAGPVLESERLVLSPFARADVDALHALWTDADVRRYLWDGEVIDRATAAGVVEASIDGFAREGLGMWCVRLRGETEVVGFCGFRRLDGGDEIELLYGLLPSCWRRGLATEAARAALGHAMGTLGHARVVAATDPPNTASVRVMERLGMRFWKRGTLHGLDTVFYALERAAR